MKKRNPAFVYIFTFLSGGIYFIYWLFSQVEEINNYQGKEVIKFKPLMIKFLAVFFLYAVLFIGVFRFAENDTQVKPLAAFVFICCFALAVYWFVLIIGTFRKIGKEIGKIQIARGADSSIDTMVMTVLFFVYFTGIIYLQSNINKIVDEHTAPVKNSKRPLAVALLMLFPLLIVFASVWFVSLKQIISLKNSPVLRGNPEIIRMDITPGDISETYVVIELPGEYGLWADLDISYSGKLEGSIIVEIWRNGAVVFKNQYKPLDTSLSMNMAISTVMDKTKLRVSNKLGTVNLGDAGDYTIKIDAAFDGDLTELRRYQLFIK